MAKNVGKTTVLNYLIDNLDTKYALTSIGVDGENIDFLTGTSKPRIYVKKGSIIATSINTLAKSDFTYIVKETTNVLTALGEVVIVEVISDGFVLLAGASIKGDIKEVIEKLKKYQVKHIFIDGAIDRNISADSFVSDAVIIATGANYSTNLEKLVNYTAYKVKLFDSSLIYQSRDADDFYQSNKKIALKLKDSKILSTDKSIISNPDFILDNLNIIDDIMIDGALTDQFVLELLNKTIENKAINIILRNPISLFISPKNYQLLLQKNFKISFYQSAKVLAVTINPVTLSNQSIDKQLFISLFQKKANVPVFDVVGEEYE